MPTSLLSRLLRVLPLVAALAASPALAVDSKAPAGDGAAIGTSAAAAPQPATKGSVKFSSPLPPGCDTSLTGIGCPNFTPPVAMVRRMRKDTELPALRLSLALINFVGEVEPDPSRAGGPTYAILPLAHESLLEIYDMHLKDGQLFMDEHPAVSRLMGGHEAYVLRLPEFGAVPTQRICVTTRGERHCWNPGFDDLGGGFIRWSSSKGIR